MYFNPPNNNNKNPHENHQRQFLFFPFFFQVFFSPGASDPCVAETTSRGPDAWICHRGGSLCHGATTAAAGGTAALSVDRPKGVGAVLMQSFPKKTHEYPMKIPFEIVPFFGDMFIFDVVMFGLSASSGFLHLFCSEIPN